MIMSWTRCATLAGALAIALSSRAAMADAVGPPPSNCPDGTMGNSCHGGVYCQPDTCTKDSDCATGQTCASRSFCVAQVSCFNGFDPDAGPDYEPNAEVACASAADCDDGAVCTLEEVCVTPGSGGSGGSSGTSSGSMVIGNGCSCETIGGSSAPTAITLLVLGAAGAGAVARRRRDQRASRQRRA
jgi:MYXO-CTERM domain-containing protein